MIEQRAGTVTPLAVKTDGARSESIEGGLEPAEFGTVDGQIITFFVMTVAAAEAAVGLALVIGLFRHRESLNPEAFTSLKW